MFAMCVVAVLKGFHHFVLFEVDMEGTLILSDVHEHSTPLY